MAMMKSLAKPTMVCVPMCVWRGVLVTEQKQAQAKLIAQKQALATLQERERLARDLHDTLIDKSVKYRTNGSVSILI